VSKPLQAQGTGSEPDYAALADQAVAEAEHQPRNVDVLLDATEILMRAGDLPRATAFARNAASIDPASFRAARTLSGILYTIGERAEGIRLGEEAVRLSPAHAEARLHLGAMLATERRWREAAQHLSIHVASKTATPHGWRLLSTVLHHAGQIELATDAARHAITADPNNIESRLHLASLLGAQGHYGVALDELTTAVAQAPNNARVWRSVSGIHAELGQLGEALRSAERAVALAENDGDDREDRVCREHLAHVARLCALPMVDPATTGNPTEWTIGPRRRVLARRSGTGNGLAADVAIRWRVILAIVLRDVRARCGEMRLGYVWAVLEPITHLLTLGLMFYLLNHGRAPLGDSLFLYYITGLVPYLMFSHVSHDVMLSSDANSAMLLLPIVKRTDVMMAHALRQFATESCVGIIIFGIAALLGEQALPADPLTATTAILLMWLLALGVGACSLVIMEMFPSYHTLYASLLRLLYFGSGLYYSPINMPDAVRDWLAWNPILQAIEYFRSGFYNQYEPHWLDVDYLLVWVITTLCIGFAFERAMRARMVVHQ
jgi:capsular polysaccharide transport system permease protein